MLLCPAIAVCIIIIIIPDEEMLTRSREEKRTAVGGTVPFGLSGLSAFECSSKFRGRPKPPHASFVFAFIFSVFGFIRGSFLPRPERPPQSQGPPNVQIREAKVQKLQFRIGGIGSPHEILGFDVPMDDVAVMQVTQGLGTSRRCRERDVVQLRTCICESRMHSCIDPSWIDTPEPKDPNNIDWSLCTRTARRIENTSTRPRLYYSCIYGPYSYRELAIPCGANSLSEIFYLRESKGSGVLVIGMQASVQCKWGLLALYCTLD